MGLSKKTQERWRDAKPKCKQAKSGSHPDTDSTEEKVDMTGHHRVFMECLIGEPIGYL